MARRGDVVLREILDAIDLAREATTGAGNFEAFAASKVHRAATERAIEIVSEAARHLPEGMTARYPHIPWAQIRAIGNKVRHEYHRVEPKIIWDAVVHDLPHLEVVARRELAREG